jgi:Fe-S oxidoreductase
MGLFGLFEKSENWYFPGCYTQEFLPHKVENYRKILKKLGIDFKLSRDPEFICCGGFLDQAGYDRELRKLAKKNQNVLLNKGCKKIITNCPLCYDTLKKYGDILPDWNIRSEFIVSTILAALRDPKNAIKKYLGDSVAYYDSCCLARYSEFTEPPRELIGLLGFNLIELPKNREESLCCGSCGNLQVANNELAGKIAKNFLEKLIKKGIKRVVTADPMAYNHLRKSIISLQIDEKTLELIELSELVCDSLGIKRSG